MSTLKKCGGHKGHHECANDYPDHMVPPIEFGVDNSTKDGLRNNCRRCHNYGNTFSNAKHPRHPLTGQRKVNWKSDYAQSLGSRRGDPEWQSYLDKAEVAWDQEVKSHLLNTASAEEVLAYIEKRTFPKLRDKKPKFNDGKYKSPLARAVAKSKVKQSPGFAREGPGFVYVYEDEMKMPGVLKIGSTQYSNGRLTSANTWGAFTCLYEKEFERRYEAEAIVHEMLDYCRIYRDKEWFRVTLTVAIETIGEVRIDIRKKQKMG